MNYNYDLLLRRNVLDKYGTLNENEEFGKVFSKKEQSMWHFVFILARKQAENMILTLEENKNILESMLKTFLSTEEMEKFSLEELFDYLKDK